jgi:hypothetical protein
MSMRSEWEATKPAIRQRIQLFAAERKLSVDQIATALTCKDKPLLQFAKDHKLSLDWLLCGDLEGLRRMARGQMGGPSPFASETKPPTASSTSKAAQAVIKGAGLRSHSDMKEAAD